MQRPYFLRRSSILLILSFLVVAILPACIVVVDEDDDDDHYRRRWSLDVIVYGSASESESPANKSDYSLNLSDESILSGQADCTGFRGGYSISDGNSIEVESLSASGSACGTHSLAGKYLEGLEEATSYTVSGDELVLKFGDSGNSMRFSAMD